MAETVLATAPSNRRVLVSGAAGGLGRAIVAHLLACDCRVAACDLETPSDLAPISGRLSVHEFDLQSWSGTGEGVAEAVAALGGCDAVVANAAVVSTLRRASRFSESEWMADINVNLSGAFRFVQAAYPALRQSGAGRVVFISSIAAERAQPGQVAYAASKAGLLGAMRTLGVEWAADGITCNAILPGMIETPRVRALHESVRNRFLELVPARRFGSPAELAGAVAFLLSPAAGYITGTELRVDGGFGLTQAALTSAARHTPLTGGDDPAAIR